MTSFIPLLLLHALAWLLAGYGVLYLTIVAVLALLTPAVTMPGSHRVRVRFRAWLPRWFGHDGTTVFGIIWVADTWAPADLIAHEFRHTQQERSLWYVGYLPVYYWRMWRAHGYYADAMEVDARTYAAAHMSEFAALGTQTPAVP